MNCATTQTQHRPTGHKHILPDQLVRQCAANQRKSEIHHKDTSILQTVKQEVTTEPKTMKMIMQIKDQLWIKFAGETKLYPKIVRFHKIYLKTFHTEEAYDHLSNQIMDH